METVGPYRVLGELGRGAMGVVYRAHDPASDREVALKLLQRQTSERSLARFRREGELTARLNHPGIIRVHAAGDLQGRPWIAYELVERATTLREAFAREDRRTRVRQVCEAARALGYAHRQGVVHRDVKPENVLVLPDGQLRVADFGLARAADLEALTRTGAMLGTPTHMAPEQFKGGQVGPPADVWALGVLLFEALTGSLPFDGSAGVAQLLDAVLGTAPPGPSSLDPSVDRDLERVCLRALARSPEERYPDGVAFAEALEEAAAQGPRGDRRPWLGVAALALLGLGLGLLAWAALGGRAPLPPPPSGPSSQATHRPDPPSPAPTPPLSAREQREGQRQARALLELEADDARLAAAEAWLARYPGHPRFDEVEAARRLARLRVPLARRDLGAEAGKGGVLARFLDDGHLLTHPLARASRQVQEWRVAEGAGPHLRPGRTWESDESLEEIVSLGRPGQEGYLALRSRAGIARRVLPPGSERPTPPPGGAETWPRVQGATLLAARRRADGDLVLAIGKAPHESSCRVFTIAADGRQRELPLQPGWPPELLLRGLALDAAGQRLVLAGRTDESAFLGQARVQVYDLGAGTLIGEHAFQVSCSHVAIAPDGGLVAVSLAYGRVVAGPAQGPLELLRSQETREAFATGGVSVSGDAEALAFSPQGDRLYVSSRAVTSEGVAGGLLGAEGQEVRVWQTASWKLETVIPLGFSPASLSLSPNGRLLAVGGKSGELGLWQVR